MKVTLKYAGNSVEVQQPEGTTVGSLLSNPNFRAVLGFPENVQAKVDGVVQGSDRILYNEDVVSIETRANTKAV